MDEVEDDALLEQQALRIVNSYMGWSAGAGLIPVPVLDLAAISGVQLKMIHSLSKLYGVPFTQDRAKSIVAALVGGGSSTALAVPASSALKLFPVVGQIASVLTTPALAAAATYALGKVFIQHYETGGNLLNLNPHELKQYYQDSFTAARKDQTGSSAKST
jgi:uncharacterized protein (DUF697 family)